MSASCREDGPTGALGLGQETENPLFCESGKLLMSKLHHAGGGGRMHLTVWTWSPPPPRAVSQHLSARQDLHLRPPFSVPGEPWTTEQTTLSVLSCRIHGHTGSSQKTHESMTSMSVRWPRRRQGHRWATWRGHTWSCQPSSSCCRNRHRRLKPKVRFWPTKQP